MYTLVRASRLHAGHHVKVVTEKLLTLPVYKGTIEIKPKVKIRTNFYYTEIQFKESLDGDYFYFTIHPVTAIDGAVVVGSIYVNEGNYFNVVKLSKAALIKRRNYLSNAFILPLVV